VTAETLAILRDASIVLLCIEAAAILVVAVIAGRSAVRGLRWLRARLPGWLGTAGEQVTAANRLAHRSSRAVTEPWVRCQGTVAGVRAALAAARRTLRRRMPV